jgi:hypothetical protein
VRAAAPQNHAEKLSAHLRHAGQSSNPESYLTTLQIPHLIPQKVFIKSFCKSQFPHKSVNLSLDKEEID